MSINFETIAFFVNGLYITSIAPSSYKIGMANLFSGVSLMSKLLFPFVDSFCLQSKQLWNTLEGDLLMIF